MFRVNGSVLTKGPDNILPIDNIYNFERYALRLLINPDDKIDDILDASPFANVIKAENITFDLQGGKYGKRSFAFDGSSSFIESQTNGQIIAINRVFTISMWFKGVLYSQQNSVCRRLFTLGNAANNIFVALQDGAGAATDRPSLFINNTIIVNNTDTAVMDNEWHHILINRNAANEIFFFIDGILQKTKIINSIPVGFLPGSKMVIGRNFNRAGFFAGNIDEFYLLNGIVQHTENFTPSEIKYMNPQESEETFSGMTTKVKIYEDVKKYDLLYYEPANRAYKIADPKNIKKLPIRGIALEDGLKETQIKILTYGTIVSNTNEFPGDEEEFTTILPILNTATDNSYNSVTISSTSPNAFQLLNADKRKQQYSTTSFWTPGNTQGSDRNWIRIKNTEPKYLKSYSIKSSATAANAPSSWMLKGSNDLHQWTVLDTQSAVSFTANETKVFQTINPEEIEFKYYELTNITMTDVNQIGFYDRFGVELLPDFDNRGEMLYIYPSSETTGAEGWRVGDRSTSTFWSPASSQLVANLVFDFGYKYVENSFTANKINAFTITCDNTNDGKRIYVPFKFTFDGSNDNATWTPLYTQNISSAEFSPWKSYGHRVKFDLSETATYRYYRLNIQSSGLILSGGLPTSLKISQMELLLNDQNIMPMFSEQASQLGNNMDFIRVTDPTAVANYDSYHLFDGTTLDANSWHVTAALPHNALIEFGKPRTAASYSITSRNTATRTTDAKDFNLQGSNDGSIWTTLDTQANQVWTINQTKSFQIATPDSYKYYRLQVTAAQTGVATLVLAMQLFDIDSKPIVPTLTGSVLQQLGDTYYNRKFASVNMEASSTNNATINNSSNLLNQFFTYNSTTPFYHMWRTENDVLTADLTLTLPGLEHTFYDRKIDGYVLTVMQDNSNYEKFRYPSEWTFEGLDGEDWIVLDTISDQSVFDHAGQTKQFDLNQEYTNLTAVRLRITDSSGGTTVVPPTFLALADFFPTYKGVKLEFPPMDRSATNKTINKYAVYNDVESWEMEYSSSNPGAHAIWSLSRRSVNWAVTADETWMTQSTGNYAKPAVYIGLKSPKKLYAYGVFLSPLALTGRTQSIGGWDFFGSTDGVTWDKLHSVRPITSEMSLKSWPLIFKIDSSKSYLHYKFDNIYAGDMHGFEFYEANTVKKTNKLTASINNPGKLATANTNTLYNTGDVYNHLQTIGYTGLTFATAEEEYSVKYFDFNTQIEPTNPNNGDVVISTNTNIGHNIENGPMVTYLCDSLRIQTGQTLSTNVKCRGLRIIVKGDCYIDGTLSMTGKGTNYSPLWTNDFPIMDDHGVILGYIPRYGALGGRARIAGADDRINGYWYTTARTDAVRQYGLAGTPGESGLLRATGGGGSGSSCSYNLANNVKAGDGAAGSCFSGGCGGGGHYDYTAGNLFTAMPGINDGCLGGYSFSQTAYQYNANGSGGAVANIKSPGAGPISGSGIYTNTVPSALSGVSGAGGLIMLIVYGNLYVNIRGVIESKGSFISPTGFVGGGASGGGSINLFYGGMYIQNGIVNANGGVSSSSILSGNGGAGCITIDKLQ